MNPRNRNRIDWRGVLCTIALLAGVALIAYSLALPGWLREVFGGAR